MIQNGVTDLNTAKAVAKKLFNTYSNSNGIERDALEKMLIDTYKIMVWLLFILE